MHAHARLQIPICARSHDLTHKGEPMNLLQYVLSFLVVLGIVIVIHELGHYWVARWCGVKVLRFSIGFGRPLVRLTRGPDQTEWVLAIAPIGGYVRMLDEREAPVPPAELHRAFNRQSVGKRMAIVAAGPLANFVLAWIIYAGIHMYGFQEARALIGAPVADTPAAAAGFADRDEIIAVDGKQVRTLQDVRWSLIDVAVAKGRARIEVLDARNRLQVRNLDLMNVAVDSRDGDLLSAAGLRLFRPRLDAVLGVVEVGRPAAAAGLRAGDRIVSVDDQKIDDWSEFVALVVANPNKPLQVAVVREGESFRATVTPAAVTRNNQTIGRVGAGVREDPKALASLYVQQRYGPLDATWRAAVKTWEMSLFSVRMLWKMLIGELSWRNLGGPVTIADYAGQSASLGLLPFITFIALISISIGVLNLLPIPVLDGGHLMYYSIELIKGTPLSERAMEYGQRFGIAVLMLLMGFAFFNDITRLVSS